MIDIQTQSFLLPPPTVALLEEAKPAQVPFSIPGWDDLVQLPYLKASGSLENLTIQIDATDRLDLQTILPQLSCVLDRLAAPNASLTEFRLCLGNGQAFFDITKPLCTFLKHTKCRSFELQGPFSFDAKKVSRALIKTSIESIQFNGNLIKGIWFPSPTAASEKTRTNAGLRELSITRALFDNAYRQERLEFLSGLLEFLTRFLALRSFEYSPLVAQRYRTLPDSTQALANFLRNATSVTSFKISGYEFDRPKEIAKALASNVGLQDFYATGCWRDSETVRCLRDSLVNSNNTTLCDVGSITPRCLLCPVEFKKEWTVVRDIKFMLSMNKFRGRASNTDTTIREHVDVFTEAKTEGGLSVLFGIMMCNPSVWTGAFLESY